MADYWISFRIHDNNSYHVRYEALIAQLNANGNEFWNGDTSMIAIRTSLSIDALGAKLKACLTPSVDRLVMREIGKDNTRYVGDPGEGFLSFFPKAKKL